MKKYIVSVLLLSAGFSFASAQTSDVDTSSDNSCAIITSNLRYLSRDANGSTNVSILQDFLNGRGYLKSQPTGFFGSATRRAVIDFQNDNGLRATPPGYVGFGTRSKIKEIDCEISPNSDTSAGSADSNIRSVYFIDKPTTVTTPRPTYTPPTTLDTTFQISFPGKSATLNINQTYTTSWYAVEGNRADSYQVYLVNQKSNEKTYLGVAYQSQGSFSFTIPGSIKDGTYALNFSGKAISGGNSNMFTVMGQP